MTVAFWVTLLMHPRIRVDALAWSVLEFWLFLGLKVVQKILLKLNFCSSIIFSAGVPKKFSKILRSQKSLHNSPSSPVQWRPLVHVIFNLLPHSWLFLNTPRIKSDMPHTKVWTYSHHFDGNFALTLKNCSMGPGTEMKIPTLGMMPLLMNAVCSQNPGFTPASQWSISFSLGFLIFSSSLPKCQ